MVMTPRTRAAAVGGLTALVLALGTGPAWAEAPMPGSANDTVMTAGEAVLVFGGIPLAVAAVVYLLVAAPGWTRSGRAGAADAWTAEPVVVGSDEERPATTPAVEQAPETPSADTGGTSASW